MKERATLIGGTGSVESEPGKGTNVIVSVPIRQEDIANGKDQGADS